MKIVVIGGSGLIGSKLVRKLCDHGHEVVPVSPDSGVNTVSGEGPADAMACDAVLQVRVEHGGRSSLRDPLPQLAGRTASGK
jgi:nucleoside-diphosphate-sugar epimerase